MGTVVELALYAALALVCFLAWVTYRDFQDARGKDLLVDLDEESEELQRLAGLKARLLQDIKGLEFDYDTGHLTDGDYKTLKGRLEGRAIATMKKLDALRGDIDIDKLIDDELEARDGGISVRGNDARGGRTPVGVDAKPKSDVGQTCPTCTHSNVPDAKFCRECGTGLLLTCHSCQTQNRIGAKFCKGCGVSLLQEAA